MSAEVTLTVEQFRLDFPAFSSVATYPDATLEIFINRSYLYVSQSSSPCFSDAKRLLAMELMTAHLQTISDAIAGGNAQGGLTGSASVGSVSVTLTPPPSKHAFDHWMNQTAYGQQYLALFAANVPAGLFAGGSFQRVFR